MTAAIITARHVSFELPNGRELFSKLSFSLENRLNALVGPNGVGKTCLANIIAGKLDPSTGTVVSAGPLVLFRQRELAPPISVEDYLGQFYAWSDIGEAFLEGVPRESLCSSLSGGEWMRVRLACVLKDGFIVFDEPTNDLDGAARELFRRFLVKHRAGALLISHDRTCLELCDPILELTNRGLQRYGGSYSFYTAEKEREQQLAAAALNGAKRARDTAIQERNRAREQQEKRFARGSKQAARGGAPKILLGKRRANAQVTSGKRDLNTARGLDAAVRLAHEAYAALKLNPQMYAELAQAPIASQKLVAEASAFNIHHNRWLYSNDLSFSWRGGARVAIRGSNGSGKTSLLRALVGDTGATRGELRLGALSTLWLDQRLASLDDERSILENVQMASALAPNEIRAGLAKFLFPGESAFQLVRTLSGGERLRAALAQGFLSKTTPELLLLDEPTNNLDLTNIAFLEGVLENFQGALIVVSHDEAFLKSCKLNTELNLEG